MTGLFRAGLDKIQRMNHLFNGLFVSSPIWVPIVFAAYVAGHRKYSLSTLFVFLTLEAVSFGISMATLGIMSV